MRGAKKIASLFVLLVASDLNSLTLAETLTGDLAFQQMLPLYSKPPINNPIAAQSMRREEKHRFAQLQTGAYGKSEDFTAKARFAFKTDKRPMVVESRPFTLEVSTEGSLTKGWRRDRQVFSWRGESESYPSPLIIPLTVAEGDQLFRSDDLNEIWLDYSTVPGFPLCKPQLELGLAVQPIGKNADNREIPMARTDAWFMPKVLSTSSKGNPASIDMTKSKWKEKGFGYLAGRVLGLAPDEDWRYVHAKNNVVLQRRLHVRLDNVNALDISFAPGIRPVAINLLVSDEDNYKGGELISFPGLLKSPSSPDRRPGVRLNLGEALEKRFSREWAENVKKPGAHPFYLQEIIIFIPGEARALVNSKPVRGITFSSMKYILLDKNTKSPHQIKTLASHVVNVNSSRQRLVVDLRQFVQKAEFDLRKTILQLAPSTEAISCAMRVEGVEAVSTYNGNVPTFARRVEDWSRRWGGVFGLITPQPDQVESPGIIAYFPFSTLAPPTQIQSLPYRIVGPKGKSLTPDKTRLFSSGGVTVGTDGGLPQATLEEDLLVLEGRSEALEVNWPLAVRIGEKTWFYFAMEGGADEIRSISIFLYMADGSVVQRRIEPNQPQQLVTAEAEVRNVKLRILPTVSPYRFKLREMVFFEPNAASYSQAFNTPLPTPYTVVPKPVLQSAPVPLLEVEPGHIAGLAAGLAASGPLRFSTVLEPRLDWVHGVRIKYRLPPAHGDSEACLLMLQFNWANGKIERQLCFDEPNGDLFIPVANWLGASSWPQNFGALKSIDWTLQSALGMDKELMGSFDLEFSVEGWTMLSFSNQLRLSPLFFAGHIPVFADAEHIGKVAIGPYAQNFWLLLEAEAFPRMAAVEGNIEPAKELLFTLDQVVVEPRQPMSWERWRELIEPQILYAPQGWPKWLMWARWLMLISVMLLAWVTWKKGWWSPGKSWMVAKGGVHVGYRILLRIFVRAGRWCWHWLAQLNLAFGMLALGLGLWMAGRSGWSFSGMMLLVSGSLVAWGAFFHWREWACGDWPERSVSIYVRLGPLAVAMGCAMWSLGQYKLGAKALWGFSPFFGAIYALLPTLYRLGKKIVQDYQRYVLIGGWLLTTIGLYGLGLLVKVATGKTYFYTVAGLAAVLTLRTGLLMLESRFRRLFPVAAEHVYGRGGGLYFSGALVTLVVTAVVSSFRFEPIAEQLAIVVYYCLIIGVVKEIVVIYFQFSPKAEFAIDVARFVFSAFLLTSKSSKFRASLKTSSDAEDWWDFPPGTF